MTISRVVLLIGVILIILGAFGISFGPMNVGLLGIGVAFASGLVP